MTVTEPQHPPAAPAGEPPSIELQDAQSLASHRDHRTTATKSHPYDVPDDWENLDEVAATSPVENVTEANTYRHHSLEQTRSAEWAQRGDLRLNSGSMPPETAIRDDGSKPGEPQQDAPVSKFATQLYTLSYLVFFAIWGTLARLGLSALTTYPGAPVIFSVLWANFGGSIIMGYLSEDRNLFRHEPQMKKKGDLFEQARAKRADEENGSGSDQAADAAESKKAIMAIKKTIPLYVGLATGFCGSFTSFSSFMKDAFLAIANNLLTPSGPDPPISRNGGYSFMALLAVILVTVSLSLAGLFFGAHLAIALQRFPISIQYPFASKILDPLVVFVGWGSWLGAIFMAIFPPNDEWRGQAIFSIVFAPLGCLLRFYLSLYLNGKVASFPVGTFTANILGTAVLGMAWDIAHAEIGGVIGCQVLQGVEDGFCGCLTTISTWVAELSSLRRKHAYIYGSTSVVAGVVVMIAVMGGLRWSEGFSGLLCTP